MVRFAEQGINKIMATARVKKQVKASENLSHSNPIRLDFSDAVKAMLHTKPFSSPSSINSVTVEECLRKVICGDCIEEMNKLPPESIDLVVTSPPYNLRNSTGNGMKDGRGGKWANAQLIEGYETHTDNMPHNEYVAWQKDCLKAMMRLLKPTGAIFYNHKWRVQGGVLQDRHDIVGDFPVRQIIVWKRSGGINFNPGYFLPTYEVIYMICKPEFKLAPQANRQGDVWDIPQEKNNPHPAPFPIELAQRCIQSTTAQIILDPFMGSGSTAIAAEACGRDWIGIDISPEYCTMALERIENERRLF
jgi:site-specific DNA-methyltransferase (adenine-specific)